MDFDKIMKAYVMQRAIKEAAKASKAVRKGWRKFDVESDVLHKVGLARYRPGSWMTGGLSLFIAGAAVGGAVALLLAPKRGSELRTALRDRFQGAHTPDAVMGLETATPRLETNPNARV